MFLAMVAAGQGVDGQKKAEEEQALRTKAVELLREASQEVGNLRSLENRISFSAELASLMWFHDEKEARAMYASTIADFNRLLTQFDGQMNILDAPLDDDERGFFTGAKSPVERKFRIAMAVRQQIAMSVAEHDADLAYDFFLSSAGLISNPQLRKEIEDSDDNFEMQLMKQIAETNAEKAARRGTASLKNGIEGGHIDLLKKIYKKDPEKAVEFGAAILSRVKSDRKSVKGDYVFNSLLTYAAENLEASKKTPGKKAIYNANEVREIADAFALDLLSDAPEDGGISSASMYVGQIEKYAPGRAAQIRSKFKTTTPMLSNTMAVNTVAVPSSNSNSSAGPGPDAAEREREAREKNAKLLDERVKAVGNKDLPKEERERAIGEARKIISQTRGKENKIMSLSVLAAQVGSAGDKDLATEIMQDAERLIEPQPKNYKDFLLSWMVASGYAAVGADRAFLMLEDTILRANDTIAAFVKVAEFIDVQQEIIDKGEIQVGMFGGTMMPGITSELGVATATLTALATNDFDKTKRLANAFDRTEIRVMAKMLVLRSVLDKRVMQLDETMDEKDESETTEPGTTATVRRGSYPSATVRRQLPASHRGRN